jgi:hypothetical protein
VAAQWQLEQQVLLMKAAQWQLEQLTTLPGQLAAATNLTLLNGCWCS